MPTAMAIPTQIFLFPKHLESVQVDGGAYNVRQGNHSVNLAAIYSLRSHIDPFITFTGDYGDVDVAAGLSPTPQSFMVIEAFMGTDSSNGRNTRQQYKFNGQRIFQLHNHQLTMLGIE